MDIRNRKILVLGGFGMVGMAIVRKMAIDKPGEVIIASMLESEAKEAVSTLQSEYNTFGSHQCGGMYLSGTV